MQSKIVAFLDSEGLLNFERNGVRKRVGCPHCIHSKVIYPDNPNTVFFVQNSCGDWCAKFVIMQVDSEIEINICDKRFVIDSSDFVDERTVPTKVKNSLEV